MEGVPKNAKGTVAHSDLSWLTFHDDLCERSLFKTRAYGVAPVTGFTSLPLDCR